MRKRITIKNVAEAVGVSTSAVSMALRDHPRISQSKREEIKQVAKELGYVYNRHAANLRKGVSDNISICINDLRNPVFSEFLIGIEEEFRRQGKLVILCNANEDPDIQTQFIKRMLEQGSAGLLLSPVSGTKSCDIRSIVKNALPTVLFTRSFEDRTFDQIVNDDALGVQLAIDELYRQGHRRIAWIGGGQSTSTARHRVEGYQSALNRLGLAWDETIVIRTESTSLESGRTAMRRLLKVSPPITAAACFSDLLALGAVSACRDSGLTVGRDISIIGHDDLEESSYFEPALSSVYVDKDLIGKTAALHLLKRIDSPSNHPVTKIIKPRLILRKTTGIVPDISIKRNQ